MKSAKIIFTLLILALPVPGINGKNQNNRNNFHIKPADLRKSEKEIFEMVNRERAKRGLNKLIYNEKLRNAAFKHNRKMVEMNTLRHRFKGYPDLGRRLAKEGIYFVSAGENIAFGSSYFPEYFHKGFMKSRKHRENILDKRFTHCGISITGTEKGVYITEDFAEMICPGNGIEIKKNIIDFILEQLKSRGLKDVPYLKNIEPVCKNYLLKLIKGRKARRLPPELSGFGMIEIISSGIKNIRNFISDTIENNIFSGYAVSISFSRSKTSPGGRYIFVMIYRKGKSDQNLKHMD